MPNSLNVSGRLAKERVLLTRVLGCKAVSGRGGGGGGGGVGVGDVALNSLFRASLSLMLPLTCRALKELKMARLRVSF